MRSRFFRTVGSPFVSILLLFAMLASAGCGDGARDDGNEKENGGVSPAARREVLVAAAASLKEAFTEIGSEVEREDSTVKVTFNFGASNLLAKQIETGAPVDLFASAAENIMDSLQAGGLIDEATQGVFARNRLVVVGPIGSGDTAGDLAAVMNGRVERIAIAAPGVPARIYAEEALRAAGIWDRIQDRLVFGENVRQVLDYVARGEADLGLVYASDVLPFREKVKAVHVVDSSLYRPITYPAAIVKSAANRAGAEAFMRTLRSGRGAEILRRHGLIPAL